MKPAAARARLLALALPPVLGMAGCGKVPIIGVNAAFTRADAAWFEEEETLFVFYEVSAQQGIGDPSLVEISWVTDTEVVDWAPLESFDPVHGHVDIDCGINARCGSWSIHIPERPRDVDLRLRYHRDGDLALEAPTTFNRIGRGADHTNRSMVVYGVFDESNSRIQWRGRHQFPTLRNEEASELGLRRWFEVSDPGFGQDAIGTRQNPYGYGVECPDLFRDAELEPVDTTQRAVFHPEPLPAIAGDDPVVCATATVTDALGEYASTAWARKNPEVRPAFPTLRSPIREATPIPFFLEPCDRRINRKHEAMQRQRLLVGDIASTCIDDWDQPGFSDRLAATFQDAVEAARPAGDDMVLLVGLHRDDEGMARAVEDALAQVVPDERHESSPRLAGAFVFGSDARGIEDGSLDPVTLWCPSTISGADSSGGLPSASLLCAIAPDNPGVDLGPFSFNTLPILPSREQYLEFINDYSENQAGKMLSMTFRAPAFAATSDHVDLGDFGVVTFLNDERFGADANDAFSYCQTDELKPIVFRTPFMESDEFQVVVQEACAEGLVPPEFCETGAAGLLPLELLPDYHSLLGEINYELGIYWDFPFLLRMRFEAVAAASVTAFGFSLPFGFAGNGNQYLGTQIWRASEIDLRETLTQCERFCDHPVFGSAGVYRVGRSFLDFANQCYRPLYPSPGDDGWPIDP